MRQIGQSHQLQILAPPLYIVNATEKTGKTTGFSYQLSRTTKQNPTTELIIWILSEFTTNSKWRMLLGLSSNWRQDPVSFWSRPWATPRSRASCWKTEWFWGRSARWPWRRKASTADKTGVACICNIKSSVKNDWISAPHQAHVRFVTVGITCIEVTVVGGIGETGFWFDGARLGWVQVKNVKAQFVCGGRDRTKIGQYAQPRCRLGAWPDDTKNTSKPLYIK